jgi:hypothetical protein
MPDQIALRKAKEDKKEGKSPSTRKSAESALYLPSLVFPGQRTYFTFRGTLYYIVVSNILYLPK